jgi:hypothetical protein
MPDPIVKGVCLGLAVLSALIIPALGDRLLRPMELEVGQANRSDARKLLRELPERWAVRWFAPTAWLSVQQAQLQLISGDARAAAMSYFEARRASSLGGRRPELTSAEADAHLHADDRKQALKLLRELKESKSLSGLDHVNLGVALLSESGQNESALEHFEAARTSLGDHARVVAGLALARQRVGDLDGARELLEGEVELDKSEDRSARDLAKRARKALRGKGSGKKSGKKKDKRKRQAKKNASAVEVSEAESGSATGEEGLAADRAEPKESKQAKKTTKTKKARKDKPKGKKARRQARREARKLREAEERANKAAQREKQERQELEAQRVGPAQAQTKEASPRAAVPKPSSKSAVLEPPASSRPSQVKTMPAVDRDVLFGSSPAAPGAVPKTAFKRSPPPPKSGSLFGGVFNAPPKKAAPTAKPVAPGGATKTQGAAKPAAPAPILKTPAPIPAAPSLDDLFGPPSASGGGPKLPAPPAIGAAPLVPPPPISAPAPSVKPTQPASAPVVPDVDDWGSALDLPPVVPAPAPKPSKPSE